MDLSKLSDEQLENLINNHRNKKAIDKPTFPAAVEELNRRRSGGMSLQKTIEFIRERAAYRRYASYGEVAAIHGVQWNKVYRQMPNHLAAVVDQASHLGLPMLTAIIVNQDHIATGRMEPDSLKGFVKSAEAHHYRVDDPEKFLREQQEAVFAWADSG